MKDLNQILEDVDKAIEYGEGVTLDYYCSRKDLKADLLKWAEELVNEVIGADETRFTLAGGEMEARHINRLRASQRTKLKELLRGQE